MGVMETQGYGLLSTRFEPAAEYLNGAKNTRSPTTAAPLNFWLRLPRGPAMRIVEKRSVSVSMTPTLSAQHTQRQAVSLSRPGRGECCRA